MRERVNNTTTFNVSIPITTFNLPNPEDPICSSCKLGAGALPMSNGLLALAVGGVALGGRPKGLMLLGGGRSVTRESRLTRPAFGPRKISSTLVVF